jgi:predicted Zn-dependent protease
MSTSLIIESAHGGTTRAFARRLPAGANGRVDERYSLQDVGRLLGLPRSIVRGLIEAGFVSPRRGPRREYRFSFQDLVVLRAAHALVEAKLPTTRILRSLRRLRTQLPPGVPLSGLRVEAVGDAVVVREGSTQWQPDDGQYLLRFHVEAPHGRLAFLDISGQPLLSANALFQRAVEMEESQPEQACVLYREAIAADPKFAAACVNLGRLLHERKQLAEAEETYRRCLAHGATDDMLLFNLALVLEDLERDSDAIRMYQAALEITPDLAEAHYNLALLYEASGRAQDAIRHLAAYRRLSRKR